MFETFQFGLPLVQAAQAQKHVTVNEALSRLDAVAQLRVQSDDLTLPPASALEGETHVVGTAAGGTWTGQDNSIAIYSNGGWIFIPPKFGWRAWNVTLGTEMIFDGVSWVRSANAVTEGGAASLNRIIEFDHSLTSAATSVTSNMIPSHAAVSGVSARVISEISGSGVSSWSIGVAGASDRYGSGLGLALNSYAKGLSGPTTYWTDTPLEITADAGTFSGGAIRIAVHLKEIAPPRAV